MVSIQTVIRNQFIEMRITINQIIKMSELRQNKILATQSRKIILPEHVYINLSAQMMMLTLEDNEQLS